MKLAIICGILFLSLASYFYFSTSYSLSREANRAYKDSNFKEAYALSSKALEENPYNKSAFGIKSQSKQRLEVQKFMDKTKENYKRATEIVTKGKLTPKEFLELKWIYDAFLEDLRILKFTNKPTDKENLEIKKYNEWFEHLNAQLQNAKTNKK